jgi:multicomponent Na+:H+ antiporter subunit C
MEVVLAFVIGGVYAAGLYLVLRRSLVKLVLGMALLSQAANLLILTAGGLASRQAPLVPKDGEGLGIATSDPLPQALILTAIVIGFGVLAFTLVLFQRAYRAVGADNLDRMHTTDR